ncbi:MAG: PA14 domain-containing protein [Bdellovibrionota bacterium]
MFRVCFIFIFIYALQVQAQIFIPMGMWGPKTLNVIISDSPAYVFPSASAGTTVERTFTISNLGLYTVSQLTAATFATPNFNFKGGAFPGAGGNCTSTLPAASSCAVVVTANSVMGGTYNDQLIISYLASVPQSATVDLSFYAMANTSPTITTIASRNIYEANYPYIPFQISDIESTLFCSGANLAVTSSDNAVVPPANITYTGISPFCYLNIIPIAGSTGTSNIVLTVHDLGFPNITASTSFTVTAIPLVSMTILPESAIIPRNSTFQYTAVATYSDATTLDISPSATWTVPASANYTITSFTGGLLTLGTVTGYPRVNITATYLSLSDSVSATFNSATITSIFVTPTSASINVSGTVDIKCYGRTADGGTLDLTSACGWYSPNVMQAQVNNFSPKGEVTGITLGGPTIVSATYSSFTASASVSVISGTPVTVEVGTGLHARYFTGMSYNTFNNQRIDANISFAWGSGNNPVGGADVYSVLWTGQILAPETGTYTFHTNSDDGIYLWVNGTLVEDFWTDHGPTTTSRNVVLTANTKYDIVMGFFENGGGSEVHLKWKIPSSACATYAACPYVQQQYLFPTSGNGLSLAVAGTGDSNPADRDFVNDGIIRYSNGDGAGNIASGATVAAQIGGLNLTASNVNGTGLSYVAGLIGQAFDFDGVDDYFTSANTGLITGTAARSFSFWIKPNNIGVDQGIFFYGANANNQGAGASLLADGTLRALGGGTTGCSSAAGAVTFGEWNHVSIRFTSPNVNVTVNGVNTACAGNSWNTTAGVFYLGRSLSLAQRFSGSIDEFASWNVNYGLNANNHLPTFIYLIQNPKPAYTP